jgi:hypothetical protein
LALLPGGNVNNLGVAKKSAVSPSSHFNSLSSSKSLD